MMATTNKETVSPSVDQPTTPLGTRLVDVIFRRREASILLVTIVLVVYFASVNSAFLTEGNMQVLSNYTYTVAIVALGEVMLLISGQLDLSAGHVFALAPFVLLFLVEAGLPFTLGVVGAVVVASGVGLANGLITVRLGVHPFITTLGVAFALQGLTLIIANGRPQTPPGEGVEVEIFGRFQFVGIMWAIGLTVVMYIVLNNTRWGIHTFATGGNLLGAREAGVATDRIKIGNFMICSALAGFAGVLEGIRIHSFDPLSGGFQSPMFYAIAGAVIGGTALAGGSGTIIGGFLGALFLGVVRDGFTIEGVSSYQFFVVIGLAILISMILNVRLSRLRKGVMLS